ncbi:MAG: hypothetical protein LUH07_11200 [Lachnospiraceae bacterium]|nr:hypothetical protein [Lachnospiraceae bacterium]
MTGNETIYEGIYRCDQLLELLEQDRTELPRCLEGDLLEAYQSCIEKEILKMQEIRKKLLTALV